MRLPVRHGWPSSCRTAARCVTILPEHRGSIGIEAVGLTLAVPSASRRLNVLEPIRPSGPACSTDYVFDGTAARPYTETDPVHPLGAYAVSKLAGELYAQAYLDRPLIIRTSGVYGPGGLRTARGNFIELMLRLASGRQTIRVVEDHVASPAYAPAIAERTLALVRAGLHGIFHAGGGTAISWYDYAKVIFRQAGLEPELRATNEREYRTAARRPKYSALSNAKMEAAGIPPMPSLDDAVRDYLAHRQPQTAAQ